MRGAPAEWLAMWPVGPLWLACTAPHGLVCQSLPASLPPLPSHPMQYTYKPDASKPGSDSYYVLTDEWGTRYAQQGVENGLPQGACCTHAMHAGHARHAGRPGGHALACTILCCTTACSMCQRSACMLFPAHQARRHGRSSWPECSCPLVRPTAALGLSLLAAALTLCPCRELMSCLCPCKQAGSWSVCR